jgi:hypothetical protein
MDHYELLKTNEKHILDEKFERISDDIRLSSLTKQDAEELVRKVLGYNPKDQIGVYFWLLRADGRTYKIYVGKTKSLKRRLSDYLVGFQVHSPNDYKLQFFQDFIFERVPEAKFALFFRRCSSDDLTECETEACRLFRPLINERAHESYPAREKVKNAFKEYYEAIFQSKTRINNRASALTAHE